CCHEMRTANGSRQTRLILTAFLDDPKAWRHGYDLLQETGVSSGTLYPTLIRLSDQGLLESRWEEPERPGRPARHAYRLTSEGIAFAKQKTREARRTFRLPRRAPA